MWILLNNQPVCVFNIKNVTGIMNITLRYFTMTLGFRVEAQCHTYILMLINYIGKE